MEIRSASSAVRKMWVTPQWGAVAQPTSTAVIKQRPVAASVGSDAGNWDAGREAPTLPTDEHELSPLLTQIFSISKKCPTFMSIIFALLLLPLSLGILFFSCYCKQHFLNFSLSLLTASTRKYKRCLYTDTGSCWTHLLLSSLFTDFLHTR